MELGEKLKQARLETGLSQRQVCGDAITRNMLSQIENGAARPSMETLRYLAARLGKTVSYFLEEETVTSPNQAVMEQARKVYASGDFRGAAAALEHYRSPDPVFDAERQLLQRLAVLNLAAEALQQGKTIYAGQQLEQLGSIRGGYCAGELERRRLILLGKAGPQELREIVQVLPGLDEELLLRARDALDRGFPDRSEALLEAAEDQEDAQWNLLRGEVHMARQQYREAAACYHKAEPVCPEQTAPRLERCYRELEDFKQAYFYACKQRGM